jgi:hypothetical protein
MSMESLDLSKKSDGFENYILNTLAQSAHFLINKALIKQFGIDTALFLTNLIDKYKYFKIREMLHENKWFFLIHAQQMDELLITERALRKSKTKLKKCGILITKMIGIPAKEYYCLQWFQIHKALNTNVEEDAGVGVTLPSGQQVTLPSGLINKNKENNNKLKEEEDAREITPKKFELFWNIYPRKTDKGKALTSWNKLCNKKPKERPIWRILRTAILEQKKSERWQNPKFIPMPATWLNQSRWLDDPDEMKSSWSNDKTSKPAQKSGFVGNDKLNYKKAKTV